MGTGNMCSVKMTTFIVQRWRLWRSLLF